MKQDLRETQKLRAAYTGGVRPPSVPNLKRIARFFRSKVITRSQDFEIGSRDPGHAHLRDVLFSVRMRVHPPSIYQI